MNNKRISPKERGLIKGALRRVFSRSDLRKAALESSVVKHVDPERPRVKKWSKCSECKNFTPTYLIDIDHIVPIVPIMSSLEEMTWDNVIDAIWCEITNLSPICKECHTIKTKFENKERRQYKKNKLAQSK
jgi:5-methylcytosine-specific restriction endonuclease McrA